MSGNRLGSGCTVRIVAGGRPKLLCRHHSDGGDLNQDFARLRLGNRTYYWLQVQFVCKLHCFHLCHCFAPCCVEHLSRPDRFHNYPGKLVKIWLRLMQQRNREQKSLLSGFEVLHDTVSGDETELSVLQPSCSLALPSIPDGSLVGSPLEEFENSGGRIQLECYNTSNRTFSTARQAYEKPDSQTHFKKVSFPFDSHPSPTMANEEHLNIVRQGVATWNKWRVEHPKIRPDLTKADLRGKILDDERLYDPTL